MALLNYTTKIPAEKTASDIIGMLAAKGARAIGMEYDGNGNVTSLAWQSMTQHGPIPFRLPVDVDAVYKILTRQNVLRSDDKARFQQARRVAWRILKDWVEAQLALLETEMVTLDQLFLPYATGADGRTLYDHMIDGGFKHYALASGESS